MSSATIAQIPPFIAFLVLEGAVLQPPFDNEQVTHLDIFSGHLAELVPAHDGVELRLVLTLGGASDARGRRIHRLLFRTIVHVLEELKEGLAKGRRRVR